MYNIEKYMKHNNNIKQNIYTNNIQAQYYLPSPFIEFVEGRSSVTRGDLGEVRGPGPKGLIGGCCGGGGGELIGNSRAPVNRVRASYIIYYNDGRRGGGGCGRRGEAAAAAVIRRGGPERVRGTHNTQTHTHTTHIRTQPSAQRRRRAATRLRDF